MSSVNKVILVGRVGADPEVRDLPSGSSVANFNIATSEKYKGKDGQLVEQTEWHRLELWEGLAKIAQQYVKKGSQIYVEGKIKTEEWTDKEGVAKKGTKIRVLSMTLLGSPSGNNNNNNNNDNNTSNTTSEPKQKVVSNDYVDNSPAPDDDLPF